MNDSEQTHFSLRAFGQRVFSEQAAIRFRSIQYLREKINTSIAQKPIALCILGSSVITRKRFNCA